MYSDASTSTRPHLTVILSPSTVTSALARSNLSIPHLNSKSALADFLYPLIGTTLTFKDLVVVTFVAESYSSL